MSQPKVILTEDHQIVRSGLKIIVREQFAPLVVDETDNITELIEKLRREKYDILVLDVFLPDGNSIPQLNLIKTIQPDLRVLYFSMLPEIIYGRRLISLGASGFLSKTAGKEDIVTAIRTVLEGNIYMSNELAKAIATDALQKRPSNPFESLSHREFEVMLLLLEGKSQKEIAHETGTQITTIATHKSRLFEKLNVHSLLELNKLALTYNLI